MNPNFKRQPELKSKELNSTSHPVPKRMSPRQLPGVYMVICLSNNKRYYGETNNVSNRLSQHKSTLRQNIHPVVQLQHDWNLYGPECFDFVPLFMFKSTSAETKAERKILELEYISRNSGICYNTLYSNGRKRENNPFWKRTHSEATQKQISLSLKEYTKQNPQGLPLMLYGVKYPSISQASRETKHSRDTISRMLKDPYNQHCLSLDLTCNQPQLEPVKTQAVQKKQVRNTGLPKPVTLDGIVYDSINQAAKQLKCSRANIQRRLTTDEPNCFLVR